MLNMRLGRCRDFSHLQKGVCRHPSQTAHTLTKINIQTVCQWNKHVSHFAIWSAVFLEMDDFKHYFWSRKTTTTAWSFIYLATELILGKIMRLKKDFSLCLLLFRLPASPFPVDTYMLILAFVINSCQLLYQWLGWVNTCIWFISS